MKKFIVKMLLIASVGSIALMSDHDRLPESQNQTPEVKTEVIA
ncbi:hypothetical protein [Alkalihalobacillus sp. CinArs1]|nr:hypothetical protein [Alkalihalobacillus sp. CinArs1]